MGVYQFAYEGEGRHGKVCGTTTVVSVHGEEDAERKAAQALRKSRGLKTLRIWEANTNASPA